MKRGLSWGRLPDVLHLVFHAWPLARISLLALPEPNAENYESCERCYAADGTADDGARILGAIVIAVGVRGIRVARFRGRWVCCL